MILHHSAAVAGLDPIGFNLPHVISQNQWQYHVLMDFEGNNQSFFMGAFFFISALFVVSSYERKGSGKFLLDKLKRLGIPTLIWLIVILPLMSLAVGNDYAWHNITGLFTHGQIDLGVTWFCWTLIVFNACWLLGHILHGKPNLSQQPRPIPTLWIIVLFAIVMMPVNVFGLFLQHHVGANVLGFHLLKYFPMYIVMFALGIYAYRHNWLEQLEMKHAVAGMLMWIIARAYIDPILHGYGIHSDVVGRGFTVMGMSLFLLYAFKIVFDHRTTWTKVLSRIAFAAYAFQIPFLFIAAKCYQPVMTQMPLVNFVVIAIPSVFLSFAFGWLICKTPWLKSVF